MSTTMIGRCLLTFVLAIALLGALFGAAPTTQPSAPTVQPSDPATQPSLALPPEPASEPSTEPAAAPSTIEIDVQSLDGIDIPYPKGWSPRQLAQLGGLLIICPTADAGWQSNIFAEVRPVTRGRLLADSLESKLKELKERKHEFKLLDKRLATHPHGFEYGVIDYTCRDVSGVPLAEHQLVIALPNDRRLMLLFSTADASREKYDPIFERVVDALRLK